MLLTFLILKKEGTDMMYIPRLTNDAEQHYTEEGAANTETGITQKEETVT